MVQAAMLIVDEVQIENLDYLQNENVHWLSCSGDTHTHTHAQTHMGT